MDPIVAAELAPSQWFVGEFGCHGGDGILVMIGAFANAPLLIAPNLLQRQFEAGAPNKKWLADFTYVWTAEGWLYVAVVLDRYPRRVVGWSMKSEMTALSRRGDCWDNAAMESFFSSPKTERVDRKQYVTRDDARADVFDCIERFDNPRRRHSVLDSLSPVQLEEMASAL